MEDIIKEIKKNNEILGFISEFDNIDELKEEINYINNILKSEIRSVVINNNSEEIYLSDEPHVNQHLVDISERFIKSHKKLMKKLNLTKRQYKNLLHILSDKI